MVKQLNYEENRVRFPICSLNCIVMKKQYILNLLLLILTLILIFTLKGALFYSLTYYTFLLGLDDLNDIITNFYKIYLFKPIYTDNNTCNFCFEILFRFNFDSSIFKFTLLLLIVLLLSKHHIRDYTIEKKDYFVLPVLIIGIIFLQKDIFLSIINLNSHNLNHFLQYIVYLVIYFEFFILFPLLLLFIYKDTKFNLYFKVMFIIFLNYFVLYHIFYCCHFLNLTIDEINNFGYSQGLHYILNSYGIGTDCMYSKLNTFHPRGTNPCDYYKYMLDYNCATPLTKSTIVSEAYTQQCKIIEEEFRKSCLDILRTFSQK